METNSVIEREDNNMKTNGKVKAMIRLLVMVVLAVNAALTVAGKNPVPFDETTFTEVATQVAAGLSALWAWWKNNNVTEAAQLAHEQLKAIKEDGLADITGWEDEDLEDEKGDM